MSRNTIAAGIVAKRRRLLAGTAPYDDGLLPETADVGSDLLLNRAHPGFGRYTFTSDFGIP